MATVFLCTTATHFRLAVPFVIVYTFAALFAVVIILATILAAVAVPRVVDSLRVPFATILATFRYTFRTTTAQITHISSPPLIWIISHTNGILCPFIATTFLTPKQQIIAAGFAIVLAVRSGYAVILFDPFATICTLHKLRCTVRTIRLAVNNYGIALNDASAFVAGLFVFHLKTSIKLL
jgi:hypothetical protein